VSAALRDQRATAGTVATVVGTHASNVRYSRYLAAALPASSSWDDMVRLCQLAVC